MEAAPRRLNSNILPVSRLGGQVIRSKDLPGIEMDYIKKILIP